MFIPTFVRVFVCRMMGRFKNRKEKNMEPLGIMGFIFGLGALGKVIMLEKQLKESGVLKEKTESDDK